MPLHTTIIRDGEPLALRWGDFHIAAMALAASFDDEGCANAISDPAKVYDVDPHLFDRYPDAPFPITPKVAFILTEYGALSKTPLNDGVYTLRRRHKFIDRADGEILELLPGDQLHAMR